MKPSWTLKWGCVILPASTRSRICYNNIQKQAAKNKRDLWNISASYFRLPAPPVPLLPASIHPSSLLFISVSMWHQLYPLLPLSLSSLKAESLLLRSDLSPSLPPSVSLSPSLLIFLPSTHNEWLKNVHCVVSACVFVRADTVSEATFNPERERERRNGRLMSRWWQKYESLKAEGRDEWLQLLTPPKVTAREPKRTKGFELRNRKRDANRRCD